MISNNRENYLKTILKFMENQLPASNSAIAKELNIARASVSEMLDKLTKQGYVAPDNEGFILTDRGLSIAKNLISKHRLWELFLIETLHYSSSTVHKEAEELEHATSDELMAKLYDFLGQPKCCPHGSTIYLGENKNK